MSAKPKRATRKSRLRPPWGKLLDGKPIEDLSRTFRLPKTDDEPEEDRAKKEREIRREMQEFVFRSQFRKMMLVKEHYGIKGEAGWRPWYNLALAIACEIDATLKIIDPKPERRGKTAPRWRGPAGLVLINEVAGARSLAEAGATKRSKEKLVAILQHLREVSPDRYGIYSLCALERNYYQALNHWTEKQNQTKRSAS